MQEIINELTDQVDETDEQRAQRLEETAADAGINPQTLYEVEQEVRDQTRALASDHQQRIDEGIGQLQQLALMFGIDPEDASTLLQTEAGITLLSQYVTARPRLLATAVKSIDSVLEKRGLYEEIDVDEDVAGALEDAVDESE